MDAKKFKSPQKRGKGFSQASSFMRPEIQKASESRGFSQSRLLTHWSDIAGSQIANKTRPVKVSYSKGGLGATLVLLVKGANAPMVQLEIPQIIKRVNSIYGYNAISRIKLTQTAAEGFSEEPEGFDRAGATEPSEQAKEQAKALASEVENNELRNALTRLGSHVISR